MQFGGGGQSQRRSRSKAAVRAARLPGMWVILVIERKWILFVFSALVLLTRPCQAADSSLGIASWYSESDPGINPTTANGEIFDDSQLTCASWDYPFGTYLRVTDLISGRSIVCRVNDRGPAKRLGRLIDLTKTAFRELAQLRFGLIQVKVEVIEPAYKNRFPREEFPPKSKMPGATSARGFSSPHKNQGSSPVQSLVPPKAPGHSAH